jgi:hypothetical protein
MAEPVDPDLGEQKLRRSRVGDPRQIDLFVPRGNDGIAGIEDRGQWSAQSPRSLVPGAQVAERRLIGTE